jgi:phosphopantothenoylcysteine decarboxylase/phosphopantothenate--cysteine ligase
VTLIAANVALDEPPGARRIDVETTSELAAAVAAEFPAHDVLLMAAAVADFRPDTSVTDKLQRETGGVELRLAPTEDIVAAAARDRRREQTIVGFAAERGAEAIERAASKLERKGLDAVVFNDVARADIGFDSDRNEVTVIEPAGRHQVPKASKEEVADAILDRVEAIRKEKVAGGR